MAAVRTRGGSRAADEEFNRCIGADFSGLTEIGDANSQDFTTGESTDASSEATIFKSDQQAEDGMSELAAGMNGSAAEQCFQDVIEEGFEGEEGFKLGEVDIGELSLTTPDVEETKAWKIVIPVEITSGAAEGLSPNVYIELVALREGDAAATVTTLDALTEFDPELRNELVQTVAGRMSEPSS